MGQSFRILIQKSDADLIRFGKYKSDRPNFNNIVRTDLGPDGSRSGFNTIRFDFAIYRKKKCQKLITNISHNSKFF